MAIRAFKIGGISTDTPSEIVTLVNTKVFTGANFQTMQTGDGTNYQIPALKTFYVGRIILLNAASGSGNIAIGYGDTSVNNSASAPTTPIYIGDSINGFNSAALAATWTAPDQYVDGVWLIPAGKFPFIKASGANGSAILMGIVATTI